MTPLQKKTLSRVDRSPAPSPEPTPSPPAQQGTDHRVRVLIILKSGMANAETDNQPVLRKLPRETDAKALWEVFAEVAAAKVTRCPDSLDQSKVEMTIVFNENSQNNQHSMFFRDLQHRLLKDYSRNNEVAVKSTIFLTGERLPHEQFITLRATKPGSASSRLETTQSTAIAGTSGTNNNT